MNGWARFAFLGMALVAISGSLTSSPCVAQAAAHSEKTIDFAIAAQPLSSAILSLSEQSGVQMVLDADVASRVSAGAVKGRLSVSAALDRLLAGTGLVWRYLSPNTITIERGSASPGTGTQAQGLPEGTRVFTPLQIEGDRDLFPLSAGGSTDPTATEGTDKLGATLSRAASKTPRSPADTPRSVSTLTSARLEEQGLDNVSEALLEMPGITGSLVDGITGYSFLSRGYDVTTFSFDGGGPTSYQSPFDADARMLLDTPELAEFDHIELLRGAVGPYAGPADPGGVINLQRKGPLDHPQLSLDLQLGSWQNHRIEVDASTPIAFDGRLRARLVAVSQDRDFYYHVTHEDRAFIYGTMEAEIGSSLLVRFGGSYRDLQRPGVNAAGLPRFSDGQSLGLPRSTCLCLPSNRYDARQGEQFLTAEWRIGDNWRVTANGTRRTQVTSYSAASLMTLAVKGGDIENYPFETSYDSDLHQTTGDLAVTGSLKIGASRLGITAGADYFSNSSLTSGNSISYYPLGGMSPLEALAELGAADFDQPIYSQLTIAGQILRERQFGPYLDLSFQPVKRVSIEVNARKSFYHIKSQADEGLRFAALNYSKSSPITPSVSISYALDRRTNLYFNYSHIFRLISKKDFYYASVGSASGDAYEAGIKWQPSARAPLVSLAGYYQPIFDLAVPELNPDDTDLCCNDYIHSARSYGLDLEVTGTLMPGWQIQATYNWNRNKYRFNKDIIAWRPLQPENEIKIWTKYSTGDGAGAWTFGGGLRIESERYSNGQLCSDQPGVSTFCLIYNSRVYLYPLRFIQPLYAVSDVLISRNLSRGMVISLNINNITDAHYLATTAAPAFGNYYGEPRSFLLSFKTVIK